MMQRLLLILLVAFSLTACNTRKSKFKPLPLDQMKLITWDMMKAAEWYLLIISKDSTLRNKKEDIRLYAQVFKIYGVTKEQYYDSYKYYEAHPTEFKILADSLEAYSTREKNRIYEKQAPAH
jgi:hypothetical protein